MLMPIVVPITKITIRTRIENSSFPL